MYTISCKVGEGWKWKPHIKMYGRTLNTVFYTAKTRGMSVEQYVIDYAHKEKVINCWAGVRVVRDGKVIYQEEEA